MTDPTANTRARPVWTAILARLDTPESRTITRSARRPSGVYLADEDYGQPENTLDSPWGRQVVVPATTLWPASEQDGYRGLNWLVRSEMHNFTPSSGTYRAGIALERLQQIAFEQLVGWAPSPSSGVLVRRRVWRERPPQGLPEWDEDRNLWWLSSEFRCEATRISL